MGMGMGADARGEDRLMRYFRPTRLSDALAIRRDHAVTVLAGGTDVYPAAATRRAWGHAPGLECRGTPDEQEDRCRLPTSPQPTARSPLWC